MGDGSRLAAPRFDPKGKSRASTPSNGDILAMDLGSAEEGTVSQNGDAFMQMQLVEQQVCTCRLAPPRVADPLLGHVYTVTVYCDRVYRIDNSRARADIHTACTDGR